MVFANLDRDALRAKVLAAYNVDDLLPQQFRGYARRLVSNIKSMRKQSANNVSLVSSDAGDDRIAFNPAVRGKVQGGRDNSVTEAE